MKPHLSPPSPPSRLSRTATAITAAWLGLQCVAMPSAHAASACHVDATGATPPGCMGTTVWSGAGQFEPAILNVVDGGQYARTGTGLYISNSNTGAAGGNSGTRGIYAYGQSTASPPEPSRVGIDGYTRVTIAATNVYNPTSNEGVYASRGAQVLIDGNLAVFTSTTGSTYTARAVVAHGIGVGTLATTPSRITAHGTLDADTTQAAQTAFAVEATDGGQITVQGGGSVLSARSGVYVRAAGVGSLYSSFTSTGAAATTLQAGGNGVTLEGAASGNPNPGTVEFGHLALTAHDSGVRFYSGNSASSTIAYRQNAGSITSTHGSAIAFTGGNGTANADLIDVAVATQSPTLGGVDADSAPIGYAVVSTSGAENRLHMNGGSLSGPITTDSGARLWLDLNGTAWNTGGQAGSMSLNSMTGMSGTVTLRMDDINDRIDLRGDSPALGTGCGAATVTLQIPTNQPAPAASPHTLMLCNNIAAAPTVTLQGGSVVLGGFNYTMQVTTTGQTRAYQLVRGSAAPTPGPGAGAAPIPTLSQWGLAMLSGLLGLAAWLRRQRGRVGQAC